MLTVPHPDTAEIRDNATFDAILQACARPGTVKVLPETGALCLAFALLDRECRVFAEDTALADAIAGTGAHLTAASDADHVFMSLETEAHLRIFASLRTGSMLYPDEGATVIVPALIGEGRALTLSGPGIRDSETISLGGLHPDLWAARARLNRYPEGIEMLFIDGDRLLALPRSTHVTEV